MTDANKIVAAIFAAGMCNKPGASGPEDYLRAYYAISRFLVRCISQNSAGSKTKSQQ